MRQPAELGVIVVETRLPVIGEPRHEQGISEIITGGHGNGVLVAERTLPGTTVIKAIEKGNVNRSEERLIVPAEPNGGGEEWESMGEVRGSVQRIDNPLEPKTVAQAA